ncbi:hypothetical protein HNQ36_005178 [Afipia massiliensis]|uniref:Uncharacterized protein n=1 Tax=Afipia massiliensis TaxID=211460 RepID=A0A840N988_9BRAD|nr:hypothetical protein [Afipia massiliensis]
MSGFSTVKFAQSETTKVSANLRGSSKMLFQMSSYRCVTLQLALHLSMQGCELDFAFLKYDFKII